MKKTFENRQFSVAFAATALLLAAANFAARYPGTLTPDSETQLGQVMTGVFTDWHPPLMAVIWSLLGGTIPAMLALQVGLHWIGFWALAEAVRREDAGKWAWAMCARSQTGGRSQRVARECLQWVESGLSGGHPPLAHSAHTHEAYG